MFSLFHVLANKRFRRLYAAHAISLFGDSFTWVGLALLAFEIAPADSAVILATALTLRVTAYVLVAPLAGMLADRYDRRMLMIGSDIARALTVIGFFFITEIWQIHLLMFVLNFFTALFRPSFESSVPEVAGPKDTDAAIALSSATSELFGVLGPGIAGGIAALIGSRYLFIVDGATFLLSAVLLLGLSLTRANAKISAGFTLRDVNEGTRRLFADRLLRYVLGMELAAAVAGAVILVNTVMYVRGTLGADESHYGWVMMAFGLGAAIGAIILGSRKGSRKGWVLAGTFLSSVALLPVIGFGWLGVAALWLVAGAGQNWVNMSATSLIAHRTEASVMGRVYGAHFAWSHLWWVAAYPLAGWLGTLSASRTFLVGGGIALAVMLIVHLMFGRATGTEKSFGADDPDRSITTD